MNEITIGMAILASMLYALTHYLHKYEKGEMFDAEKLLSTLLIGGIVGAVAYSTGHEITEQYIWMQLIAYGGAVAIVENLLKSIVRITRGKDVEEGMILSTLFNALEDISEKDMKELVENSENENQENDSKE